MDFFTFNHDNRNDTVERSFFPGGEFTLPRWKACVLDWLVLSAFILSAALFIKLKMFSLIVALLIGFVAGCILRKIF